MERRALGIVLCLVALATSSCSRPQAAVAPDGEEIVRAAGREAVRSAGCAADLERAVERDPGAVASTLRMEPVRLAPHGGPSVHVVRAEIAERLWDARADAAAAAALARCADAPGALANASRRAARSLAASAELCRAAEVVRGE